MRIYFGPGWRDTPDGTFAWINALAATLGLDAATAASVDVVECGRLKSDRALVVLDGGGEEA